MVTKAFWIRDGKSVKGVAVGRTRAKVPIESKIVAKRNSLSCARDYRGRAVSAQAMQWLCR